MAYDVNQIISPDALKQVDQLEKKTGKVVEQILKIHKETAQLDSVLSKIDGKNFQKLEKETKKAVTQNNKLKTTTVDLQKVHANYLNILKKEHIAKQKTERLTKREIAANKSGAGSYKRLSLEMSRNIDKYHSLSAAERANNKIGGQLLKTINKQDKALKKMDVSMGKHNRFVGRYKDALSGLKMGYIAAAAAVAGMIRVMKGWVDAADIQAKAEAKLLTALKGEEDVQQRLIMLAKQRQKVTLFGDEETINAQAYLATMGLNETAIKKLTPLVQDFATKAGTDLKSAADMIAKSVGSSTNAMSRYGITIEGAVGSSERLNSAIDALNKQVGGQSEAAALAGAGAVKQFQNSWGDLEEFLGTVMLPSINKFFRAFTSDLNSFMNQMDALKFMKDAGIGEKGFWEKFFGGNTVKIEAEKMLTTLVDLSSASKDEIQKEIDNAVQKIGIYSGELGKEWNALVALYVNKLQGMLTASDEATIEVTNKMDKSLKKTIDANIKYVETSKELYADFYDELEQDSDDYFDTVIDNSQKEVDATNDKLRKQEDAEAAKRDREIAAEKALAQEIRDAKIQLAQESVNAAFDIYASSLEKQRMQLDQQRNYELNAAGDDAAKKDAINKKYAKKEAELKTKQAKADKLQSMFNIAIQTAVNIVKSYPNPILMALAAAIGGVQEIAVAARPIPKFAKGTKHAPGGLAEVGEAGHELIEQDGRITYVEEPTIMNLQKGAKVYTKKETDRIFKMAGKDDYFVKHAIDRQTSEIVSAINNKTELHISRGGHRIVERKGNYYKEYLSRKIEL